jgi:hypothetical protein
MLAKQEQVAAELQKRSQHAAAKAQAESRTAQGPAPTQK